MSDIVGKQKINVKSMFLTNIFASLFVKIYL